MQRLSETPVRRARGFGRSLCLVLALAIGGTAFADDPKPAPAKPAAKPPAQPSAKPAPAKPAPAAPKPKPPVPGLDYISDHLIHDPVTNVVTYFYRTNFVKPTDLAKSLQLLAIGSKSGIDVQLKPFAAQNQLLISGNEELVMVAVEALRYFDVAAPQVFIEAKIIEITYDSNFEFGLDWVWDRGTEGPAETLFRGSGGVLNPPSFLGSTFPGGFPFEGTSTTWGLRGETAEKWGALDVTYQALLINGKAEILSKPSIIATQGIEASVTTEEVIPVARFDNADVNNTRFRYDNVKSGVTLKVTPNHVGEGFVTLKVAPSVRGIQGLASSRVAGLFSPITTSRTASTTVTLADGETLVIGGLYTNQSVKEKAKTPLFSDLPLVGELFTRTRETKQKTELVFILTPHIVRKTGDLKIVTPPSELERLERSEDAEESCKPPRIFRKPGAYLDEFDD